MTGSVSQIETEAVRQLIEKGLSMSKAITPMPNTIQEPVEQEKAIKEQSLYETDFYAWSLKTAELIRQGRITELDLENIAEEIESLGRNNKRELLSRLSVLIMHLLKWQFQSNKHSKSWKATIRTQRDEVEFLVRDNPSLKYGIENIICEAFLKARLRFEDETGISYKKTLPETCPYTWEQITKQGFMPE
ncbi:protein of unknown function DUF29 [Candidatus Magnetoovum chiemensis]|nr:protein of unknown function DUF29 [Candidatus Magnetoovum chiemensis]